MEGKNLYQKIQQIRVDLEAMKLPKTGEGDDWTYYQLGDFMAQVNVLLNDQGLMTRFSMDNEKAWLIVTENGNKNVKFEIDKVEATIPDAIAIQNKGATITYLRRYLHIIAFEIIEDEPVELSNEIKLSKKELVEINKIEDAKELQKHILGLKLEKGVKYQKVIIAAYNERKGELSVKK